MTVRLEGVYPILLTAFDESGAFDAASQRDAIDFLIAAGVDGIVTLANAGEGYAVSDAERDLIVETVVRHTAGRVPVVVGVSHPSTRIAIERSRAAEGMGAQGVLSLPPFYGQWTTDAGGVFNHFAALSDAVAIPVIVQDHPLAGTAMPSALLARIARETERARYFKIEVPRTPAKVSELLALAGERVLGVFGGMNGILFPEELRRGCRGVMPSSATPEVFVAAWRAFQSGGADAAAAVFDPYLPLLQFELQMAGRNFQKELLKAGGIIASARVREPVPPAWDDASRERMMAMASRFNLFALRYKSPKVEAETSPRPDAPASPRPF